MPRLSVSTVALAALACLYAPVAASLARTWASDANFSHGFLVPLVSIWLIWRDRNAISEARSGPGRFSLPLLAIGLATYALGRWAEIDFAPALSLLFVLVGVCAQYLGWRAVRRMWFALAFLVFAIPWPDVLVEQVSFPMQLLSTTYAAMMLGILGIPAQRSGVQITVHGYAFEVGAPCSGMRSLVALLALAALMAYLLPGRPLRRLALFASGAPLALAANAIRIACILVIAARWGPRAAEGFLHSLSGIMVFALAAAGLLAVARALNLGARQPAADAARQEAAPPRARPAHRPAAAAVLAITVAAAALILAARPAQGTQSVPHPGIPMVSGGWQGRDLPPLDKAALKMLAPEAYVWRIYRRGDDAVLLTVLYGRDKRTFHAPGFCLLGQGWSVLRRSRRAVGSASGEVVFNELLLQRGGHRALVMYSFLQGNRSTPSWFSHQARLLAGRVLRRGEEGALVRVIVPVAAGPRQAARTADQFLAEFLPHTLM